MTKWITNEGQNSSYYKYADSSELELNCLIAWRLVSYADVLNMEIYKGMLGISNPVVNI